MRPIDADAVKGLIRSGISVDTYADQDYVCELVDDIPTIDAVSVVRCKDCKHRYEDGEHVKFNVCELNHNKVQSDDWFCADGERKDQ